LTEDWLARWAEGRTGWHEAGGNAGLKSWWPDLDDAGSVLVPLCGMSPDLLWLARRGHDVAGVELSEIAIRQFFARHELEFERDEAGALTRFAARTLPLTLWCGDYFDFQPRPFDALYDRGALVALPEAVRKRYVAHTKQCLAPSALRLVVTLEYDQSVVNGPPYAVPAGELLGYWDDLVRVEEKDDSGNCPPKFRQAGLREIREVFWRSP
jgi:thiopurine S-methyltransferase